MKKTIIFLILTAMLPVLTAQAQSRKAPQDPNGTENVAAGRKNRVSRELKCSDDITKIQNHAPVAVNFRYGKPGITIEGPAENIDNIRINISDRAIFVVTADGHRLDLSGIEVTVKGKEVNSLANFGSGAITADRIDATGAKIQSFGSGDIRIETMDCTGTQITGCGSGRITIDNLDCTTLKTTLQGSGDILIKSADTTGIELILQGSGSIKIKNIDCTTIRAYNQGSGNIEVSGDATTVKLYNQGSGNIIARGLNYTHLSKVNSGVGSIRE